jgi:hypothetical protein
MNYIVDIYGNRAGTKNGRCIPLVAAPEMLDLTVIQQGNYFEVKAKASFDEAKYRMHIGAKGGRVPMSPLYCVDVPTMPQLLPLVIISPVEALTSFTGNALKKKTKF